MFRMLILAPVLMQVPSNIILGYVKKPGIYICGAMAIVSSHSCPLHANLLTRFS